MPRGRKAARAGKPRKTAEAAPAPKDRGSKPVEVAVTPAKGRPMLHWECPAEVKGYGGIENSLALWDGMIFFSVFEDGLYAFGGEV